MIEVNEKINWDILMEYIPAHEFSYLAQVKNETILMIIEYEDHYKVAIDGMTVKRFDIDDREFLLNCDSYIEYKEKPRKKYQRVPELVMVKYNILERVFDKNNNLIALGETIEGFDLGKALTKKEIEEWCNPSE